MFNKHGTQFIVDTHLFDHVHQILAACSKTFANLMAQQTKNDGQDVVVDAVGQPILKKRTPNTMSTKRTNII
jgi:hypothetical protein